MIGAAKYTDTGSGHARELLSLLEAVTLAEVPETRVRRDIDSGLFPRRRIVRIDNRRLCFHWTDVFALAAAYGNRNLNGKMRKLVLDKIEGMDWRCLNYNGGLSSHTHNLKPISIDGYFLIDTIKICDNVSPRVSLYARGLSRIEEKEGVLGGEPVFKNTRISVRHVGQVFKKGESIENILEDFPALTRDDIHFCNLYFQAHPIAGRPRTRGEARDVLIAG